MISERDSILARRLLSAALVVAAVSCGTSNPHKFGEIDGKPSLAPRAPDAGDEQSDLQVLFATPQGDVSGQPEISVSFSQPMKEIGKADQEPWLEGLVPFKLEPALEGEYRWLGSRTAKFAPKNPIPQATKFTATVPAGTRSLTGGVLGKDYSFTFTTPPPAIVNSNPQPGERWAKPGEVIDLYFNQAVDPAALRARTKLSAGGSSVPFEVGRRDEGDPKSVRLVPAKKLPVDSEIVVDIGAGLTGMEGPLPSTSPYVLSFRTYGPLEVLGLRCYSDDPSTKVLECDPQGGIDVELSNQVTSKGLDEFVKITPAVEGIGWNEYCESCSSFYIYPSGGWKPGAKYKIAISPKLTDIYGQKLQGKPKLEFETTDYYPYWTMKWGGGLLEAGGSRLLPVSVLNVDKLDGAVMGVVDESQVVPMVERMSREGSSWLVAAKGAKHFSLSYPKVKNKRASAMIDLAKALGAKSGVALLRVYEPGGDEWSADSAVVRVSSLGLTTKVSGDRVIVWVTDLPTGKPVADAGVVVRSRDNAVLWDGKTDATGVATIAGSALWKDWPGMTWEDRCHYVFASAGPDFNYVSTCGSDSISPWEFEVNYDELAGVKRLVGLVFTERGVYRPGETVSLKGIVRWLEKGKLSVPAGERFTVVVTDSNGDDLASEDVTANAFGGVNVAVPVPGGAALGYYSVKLRPEQGTGDGRLLITASFGVEEYEPPSFRVDVEPAAPEVVKGEKVKVGATGEFLFGAPMGGAEVDWWATASSGWFEPEGWEEYGFDDREYSSGTDFEPAYYDLSHSDSGVLDEKGTHSLEFATDIEKMDGPVSFMVEATVTGPDARSVAARSRVLVHPASFYLGIRTDDWLVQSGKPVPIGVIAVDTQGKALPGRKAKITLLRREWKYVESEGLYEDSYGSWKSEDTEVGTCKVTTGSEPVSCSIEVPKAGRYVIRASSKDEAGRSVYSSTSVWSWGAGDVSWLGSDGIGVEMVPDKDVYAVGDTARILVQNPFPDAEALVTVEHHTVHDVKRMRMPDRATVVEVPITGDMRPNVYVSVALVRGRIKEAPAKGGADPGKPEIRMGYVNLEVGLEDKVLDVVVKTDSPTYRPGDTVEVGVQVDDAAGEGKEAEVTVFVVDEAVLMLTGYEEPDPVGHFYRERELGVSNSDSRTDILVRQPFGTDKGEAGGGGWGESEGRSPIRQDFRTTVFFEPGLVTDATGRARASFVLPDSLTQFRVMAVASTRDDCFGSGHGSFRVSKPLLLKPALPRFLRVGDTFEAGVVVHDGGGGSGQVTVSAKADGIRLVDAAPREIDLPDGGSILVRFPFEADEAGKAAFTFAVEGVAARDAVQLDRPVLLPVVTETVATYGETTGTAMEGLGKLDGVRKDTGGLDVKLASTALVGLDRAVESLVRYPYGCAEQLTSRMVPTMALGELVQVFGMDVEVDRERLSQTVDELEAMQGYSGGWGFFSEGSCPYPWLSAYVLWGLHEAEDRGYDVADGTMIAGANYLKDVLRGDLHCYPEPYWWNEVSSSTKTYILYVLAKMGTPDAGYHDHLYDQRESLPLFSRLLLADAIHLAGGDEERIDELMRTALNGVQETQSSAHLLENLGDEYLYLMHSEVRDTALALSVLLDVDPDHVLVPKMAHWLMESRGEDGTWGCTQDDAWALLALSRYLEEREAEVPDFTAGVWFGSKLVHEASFEGRSLEEQIASIPMDQLVGGAGSFLGFTKDGAGRLYYSASLTYARSDLPVDPIDRGFFVEREYTRATQDPGSGGGGPVTMTAGSDLGKLEVGENMVVTLTIVVPGKRHFVAVEDPLPAGVEVLNSRFQTTSLSDLGAAQQQYGGYPHWYYSPFYHVEIHDDRVFLFADDLQPGIYRYSYVARATTPGVYVVSPAKAHEMYDPEVFGRTGTGTFVVE